MRLLALSLLLAVVALAGCDSGDESQPEPRERPAPAITGAELGRHLAALQRIADRSGGTRAAGTRGYDESAAYVAARLREAGWKVERQEVPFTYFRLRAASLSVDGRRLARAKEFQVLSYSGSGSAAGTLRRSGSGCAPAELAGLGEGEIPLVDRGTCFFRQKARNAERAGAEALVVVEDVRTRRGVPSGTLAIPGIRIPVVLTSVRTLRGSGDGSTVRVRVDGVSRPARTENVIAETPGGADERIVMAGGHLDSVAGGPGINDNGSGTAALIEVAEAIGPRPPGARVRLGFWAAEELGLHGSRRYVDSLDPAARDRIRAYLNLDMVGSPNPVPELYSDGAPGLGRVLRRAVHRHLRGIVAGQASDHAVFRAAGIPVNGLYTGSSESAPGSRPRDPCYHLACDTARNVDRAVLLEMSRASAAALERLSAEFR